MTTSSNWLKCWSGLDFRWHLILSGLLEAIQNPRFVKYEFRDERIAEVLTQRDLSGNRVLLVASSGGHFQLMRSLARYWQSFPNRLWATFENKTTRTMLENEAVV